MLPWLPDLTWLRAAVAISVVLIAALLVVALLVLRFGEGAVRVLARPLGRLPFIPKDALERAPAHFVRGLAGLVTPRIALVSFGWTTLSWIVLGVGFWVVHARERHRALPARRRPRRDRHRARDDPSVVSRCNRRLRGSDGRRAHGVWRRRLRRTLVRVVLHMLNVLPLFAVAAALLVARRLRRAAPPPPLLSDSALER